MNSIEHIKTTEAYDNSFFRHCREWQVTRGDLSKLAVNWECVTRSFWRASCVLVGELAKRYHEQPDLLCTILKIAAEDGGIGGGALNDKMGSTHYLLYRQMWETGTCDWSRKLENETAVLVSNFPVSYGRFLVASPAAGVAMVVVVETIALNIVEAMWHAHTTAGFDPERLDYLRLHKTLEVEHADGMGAVVQHTQAIGLNIWPHIHEHCDRWGRFWRAMDRVTFGC